MHVQLKSTFSFVLSLLVLSLFSSTSLATPYFSDSTSGYARQTIVHKLQIRKVSDLDFGEASPGDGPKTIAPGASETRENASFEVSGEPLRYFQIILPPRKSVHMINGGGGPQREIAIEEFTSYPHRSGALDQSGRSMIYVGATREAISTSQKAGDYMGRFYITVVY